MHQINRLRCNPSLRDASHKLMKFWRGPVPSTTSAPTLLARPVYMVSLTPGQATHIPPVSPAHPNTPTHA